MGLRSCVSPPSAYFYLWAAFCVFYLFDAFSTRVSFLGSEDLSILLPRPTSCHHYVTTRTSSGSPTSGICDPRRHRDCLLVHTDLPSDMEELAPAYYDRCAWPHASAVGFCHAILRGILHHSGKQSCNPSSATNILLPVFAVLEPDVVLREKFPPLASIIDCICDNGWIRGNRVGACLRHKNTISKRHSMATDLSWSLGLRTPQLWSHRALLPSLQGGMAFHRSILPFCRDRPHWGSTIACFVSDAEHLGQVRRSNVHHRHDLRDWTGPHSAIVGLAQKRHHSCSAS